MKERKEISKVRRIGVEFEKEIEEIKEEVKEDTGFCTSNSEITNKIVKHSFWPGLKRDIIKFFRVDKMNKKGFSTLGLFTFIFSILVWVIFIGVYLLIFNTTTSTLLTSNITIGNTDLGNITASTLGQYNTAFINNADLLGYIFIFGLIMSMFANAFTFRGSFPKLFILIDIILLVFAYIVAVYVSQVYEILINSTSILSIYITNMSKASTFVLNLPIYVSIIGVIIMILSYAGFPRQTQEEVIVGQIQ